MSIICLGLIKVSCTGSEPYNKITGTSMAAPFVTGVAALIWSHCPDRCTAVKIRHILKESALNPAEGVDFDPHKYGSGILNAKAAFEYARSNGYFRERPSGAPSSSNAPTTLFKPSSIPTVSQKPFGCEWYRSGDRCARYGGSYAYANHGRTEQEACRML